VCNLAKWAWPLSDCRQRRNFSLVSGEQTCFFLAAEFARRAQAGPQYLFGPVNAVPQIGHGRHLGDGPGIFFKLS
jgi:hypothetical protein